MKKLALAVLLLSCVGCASGSLKMNAEELQNLQTTRAGDETAGCVAIKVNASSGVVGGDNRSIVTWGELAEEAIGWCIGK